MKSLSFICFFVILFAGCNNKEEIRIITSPDEPHYKIALKLSEIIESELNIPTRIIAGTGSVSNLDSLSKDRADITICENYLPFNDNINAIVPLYPEVLHVLYRNNYNPANFEMLLKGKKVFFGLPGSSTYNFFQTLISEYGINKNSFNLTINPYDSVDVYAGFGDIISKEGLEGLEGFKIFSFTNSVEGICLKYPQFSPFLIPVSTYRNLAEEPRVTFSVDAILVCRKSLSTETVYNLGKAILENKERVYPISPLLFKGLSGDLNGKKISFSQHEGIRMYLERDRPGFFERYAELIGVVFSLLVAGISFVFWLAEWNKKRKKDRIDIFYQNVLSIKKNNTMSLDEKLKALEEVKEKAYTLLMEEKLEGSSSFLILLNLISEAEASFNKLKTPL